MSIGPFFMQKIVSEEKANLFLISLRHYNIPVAYRYRVLRPVDDNTIRFDSYFAIPNKHKLNVDYIVFELNTKIRQGFFE